MFPSVMEQPAGLKGTVEIVEPSRTDRSIGRRAAETRATVPDLELSAEVEIDAALRLLPEASHSALPLIVRACALALRDFPRANGAYRDGRIELYSRVNIAVVLEHGEELVTATVLDADQKSVSALAEELHSLQRRVAELTQPERSGATFTIWDPGAHGVTRASPMLSIPQAAALATGAPRAVAIVRDGTIVPGQLMELTLACDHRILYGRHAAEFLARVKQLLEQATL